MGAWVEVVVAAVVGPEPTDWMAEDGVKETADSETTVGEDDGNTTEESGRVEFCPGNVRMGSWYPATAHWS